MELIMGIFDDVGDPITNVANDTSLKIRRAIDGYLYDWNDITFKNTNWIQISDNLTVIDVINLPGYYNKNIDITQWNDGYYQFFTSYSGISKINGLSELMIFNGKVQEQNIVDIKNKTDNLTFTVSGQVDCTTVSLGNQAKLDVNSEVKDVVEIDVSSELDSIPTSPITLKNMIQFIFQYFRHKRTMTSTQETLYKEDGSTVLGTSQVNDNGTIFTKGKLE